MAGNFVAGETKIRPGVYFRTTKAGPEPLAGAISGIVAVALKANWGPLGLVVALSSPAEIYDNFGDDSATGSNTALIQKIFDGGAATVKVVRVGTGGTKAAITIKDDATPGVDAITLTAKHAGTRPLAASIKDNLGDPTNKRDLIVYTGTKELIKVTFAKGSGEPEAVVAAINANPASPVTAALVASGSGKLEALNQKAFTTAGASPTVTTNDYSAALVALEADSWNVVCVDSNETAVHAILKSFISRVTDAGLMGMAIAAEPITVALADRQAHAAAFNSENFIFPVNGYYAADGTLYDGFNAAAVIGAMIAATPSNQSLTHAPIPGAFQVAGPLTNTQIEHTLQNGGLVITASGSGIVWIEQGINTLVTLSADQDAGWKKIRRTKTRYELIQRILDSTEGIVGTVNNDSNGRQTFIAMANGVGQQMIAEGKLLSCDVSEDPANPATGDAAWFIIEVVDLDSIEKVYITYRFRFAEA